MTKNKKQKGEAYASLTGFRRAVPIILAALGVFCGMCFITRNTGALGRAIAGGLLGLFSVGGYFIPFLLILHAFFYPSDVQKKRVTSRVIFSVITVIAISSLIHAITYFGADFPFSARGFYNNGMQRRGGGFIGGAVTFCLMKIFGSVGVIIIAILIFALYVTYFFAGGKSTISRVLLKILNAVSDFFTGIGDRRKKHRLEKERRAEKKRADALGEKHEDLSDDEFFIADSGLQELSISELGIKVTRDDSDLEREPALRDRVIHEKEITVSSENPPAEEAFVKTEKPKRRPINLDYSTTDSVHNLSVSVDDAAFTERCDDIIYDEPTRKSGEESAEDVFGKDFEPFDFKLNQELAAKPSSKAATVNAAPEGICELSDPIYDITEEDIEKARQRADFEMKKKAALDAQRRYDEARAEIEKAKAKDTEALEGVLESVRGEAEASAHGQYESNPYESEYCQSTPYESKPYEAEPVRIASDTSSAASETVSVDSLGEAERIAPNAESETAYIPEYMKRESAPEESAPANVSNPYERAAAFESSIGSYTAAESPRTEISGFKPYTPPSVSEIKDAVYETPAKEEAPLKVTRTMLDPTPTSPCDAKEEENEALLTERAIAAGADRNEASAVSGLDFSFDGDDEDEIDVVMPDTIPEEETEDFDGEEEIPEEEQSEKVKAMRDMFPFLKDENEDNENEDESDEDFESRYDGEKFDGEDKEFDGDGEDAEDAPPFEYTAPSVPFVMPEPEKKEAAPPPQKPDYSDYQHPPLDLLIKGKETEDAMQDEEQDRNADKLVDTLMQFGVRVSIKGVDRGPRITRYEIVPARGVKVNSVMNLFNDIALNLGAEGIRMEAPIPGKTAIGVEIPNKKPTTVLLRDLVESDEFMRSDSKTMSCLGKDVTGNPVFADIAKMPHVLVAGATGMGKSVCINSILISILYKARPDEVKFIMVDPKKVEFNGYNGIPHLLVPVVTDVKQAAGALMWAVEQMEKRYDLMESLEVRKLDAYNEKVRENPALGEPLPKIVIVIDELNDIMLQVRKPAEDLIMSIAQKARAAGIHLIIGTQRPSVDVITGVIKANIPSRISCKVASFNDSKTILEQAGAEKLLNNGDMLYISAGAPKALRVQGAFVSDGEVSAVMKFLKSQAKGDIYDAQALEDINRAAQKCSKDKKGADGFDDDDSDEGDIGYLNDQQFLDAVDIAIRSNKISTSLLQRKIKIGYGKAAKYIDTMEEMGIVSEPNGQRPRDVLITRDEWHEMLARRSLD